ncbi:MAG TPA: aminotransferase class I/II-fold pyridoxal phosphate-dependent enzyme [Opitutales bacterium]|jgi:dTDP-4-amino-4,6-dideoxygalactose transaminase|nr:aminotransferase class I/II-fold pyridoxal phosphate-dependent enzyme [Opitutales bacterium]
MPARIYLSPPDVGPDEQALVADAFASNWIAPLGPHVDAFEREFADHLGVAHAVALSSGTAALHLALRQLGIGPGDEVFCSTLTFVASANPIVYEGGTPVFLDCERDSWNLDPNILEDALRERARNGKMPKALVLVHLYGQSANLDPIISLCEKYGVILVEDAAEALGATHHDRPVGTRGRVGVFSFNGNKIITTSGGGMLVTDDAAFAKQTRFLATQARDPAPHYEHTQMGFNYRLSNVLAAIGRGQLRHLAEKVAHRRANFDFYQKALGDLPGVHFMPEASWGRANRWLTCLTIDPKSAPTDREKIRLALEQENIEARPVWKPMHAQPLFAHAPRFGGTIADELFAQGLCLPSGSNLSADDRARVAITLRRCFPNAC